MDEDAQNRYVTQLKKEFDSCDTTGTGYLDKEELTELCHKLSLDVHVPILLDVLLGPQHYTRVNFEEFKEGFVSVLSRSLDLSTSEEESSYFEPAAPDEVSPKFVKGTKRYGRRSRPDKTSLVLSESLQNSSPFGPEKDETFSIGVSRAKLRRSTSLESVESLKSDEDTGSNKVSSHEQQCSTQHSIHFEAQGQLKCWKAESTGSWKHSSVPCQEVTDGQVRAVWEEFGVGVDGSLNKQELLQVCNHIGLKDLQSEELDSLFRKLDKDQDGRVSLTEFQRGLFRHGDLPLPTAASTPVRLNAHCSFSQAIENRVARSTSPSLLSATVDQRLLTRLDDGSGCTSPESVITLWTEEGIHNSRDILQTLDFPLEERLSLAELTLALDNELLVSGNGIHQAALISYKDEIRLLQMLANQACQERDKAKADLELADRRNIQLVKEIDDRHATMESLNESKIKDLELGFRERLSAWRTETEQENEVLLQHVECERDKLREELDLLKAHEAILQEEATSALKESSRLEEENCALKEKLSETESTISKLKIKLDHVLQDKYGGLDPNSTGLLNQEEHLSGIIKEYELQCRELQDRIDELNSELEMRKNQGSGRRTTQPSGRFSTYTWSGCRALTTESDSDDPEIKRESSPQVRKCTDKNALGCLESLTPTVSIETELAMEQIKERYEQQLQDLKIQLETKVNFYERTIELMKQNMEVERKEIAQGYKVEISELEDQKALVDEQLERLHQTVERLEGELKLKSEVVAWGHAHELRVQREQAELEQNYAREISNIVHSLTSEKDQLEAELKLKMDQEVLLVREEMEEQLSQMKAEFSQARCILLHQLRDEQVRLQEQTELHGREMGKWEAKVQELEQELHRERVLSAEHIGEMQAQICNVAAQEKRKLEKEHQEEIRHLRESVCRMQAEAELKSRSEEKSLMLQKQLEEKLEEMCVQMEDNTVSMQAQDALILNLTSELNAKDKEIDIKKESEQKLLSKVSQLERKLNVEREQKLSQQKMQKTKEDELLAKLAQCEKRLVEDKERKRELLDELCQLGQELECVRTESETLQKEKGRIQGNYDCMSSALVQWQTRFEEQDKELNLLRKNLEKTHRALKCREEALPRQNSELKRERERNQFMDEIKSKSITTQDYQVQFQKLCEDWDHLNKDVQNLQNAPSQEQATVTQLQSLRSSEKEDQSRLLQENSGYRQLADQLSSQIVEMEVESTKLMKDLEALRVELQHRDNQVLELRAQLDAKTKEMDLLWNEVHEKMDRFQSVSRLSDEVQLLISLLKDKDREMCSLREEADNSTNQLQQLLMESRTEVCQLQETFEREKDRMREQLLEMEKLVVALETVMDTASPHRGKLDEVNSENSVLMDRLAVLHQDVVRLEEEVNKKRKKLEEVDREYIKIREEQERLRKENSKYREEVLELSGRNLQLSNENAELNSRLQSDQQTIHMLTSKLAQVCREEQEAARSVRQLQETCGQLEKEKLHLQITKQDEQIIAERALGEAKDKLQRLAEVESALTSLTLKNQLLQQDQENLLKDAEEKNKKLERLQECVNTFEAQTVQFHSQLFVTCKEKDAHVLEMSTQQTLLKESQDKVLELESRIYELSNEKKQLQLVHKMQEEAAASVLQEQLRKVQKHNQELLDKVKESESKLHTQELELQRLRNESFALMNKQAELQTAKHEAEEQVLRANAALSLSQAQYVSEVQQLQESVCVSTREQLAHLHSQLAEQQNKIQQLEEQLCAQTQQAWIQLNIQQTKFENLMENLQEQVDEVEAKLNTARLMLQEKVNQLKEQLSKNAKSDLLLKDLYIENAQLMKALQVTEQRQKSAEKKSFLLEEKVTALNKLLCKIAPASICA